jgi:NitT/TauT family transport system substrate-binding protein
MTFRVHLLACSAALFAGCGAAQPPVPSSQLPAPSSAAPSSPQAAASSGAAVAFNWGTSTATQASALPVLVAQQQGFDVKNGLKLSVTNAEGGSRGLQVLLGGQLQAMEVGLAPVIIGNTQGANFRLITSTTNSIPYIVYGSKGITAANAAQKLKGSKIGISTYGSESDVSANFFLEKLGLVREKDVAVVQIGGGTARLSALLGGAIGASPLTAVDQIKAKAEGLEPLLDLSRDSKWVFDGGVVDKAYAAAHQDMFTGLVKALMEGNYYGRSRPDDARKVLAQQNKTTDAQLIDAAYQEFLSGPIDLRPTDEGIQQVIKQLPALNQIQLKSTHPADYVDLSILDRLKASGFSDQLRKQYGV